MNGTRVSLPGKREWNEKTISARWLGAAENSTERQGLVLEINGESVLVDPIDFQMFADAALSCCPPEEVE